MAKVVATKNRNTPISWGPPWIPDEPMLLSISETRTRIFDRGQFVNELVSIYHHIFTWIPDSKCRSKPARLRQAVLVCSKIYSQLECHSGPSL